MRKTVFTAALLLFTGLTPALAATSADDAAKLKASLKTQFGAITDYLTITPEGDGYRLAIDSAAFAKAMGEKMKDQVTDFKMSPFSLLQKPGANGGFDFTSTDPIEISATAKDQGSFHVKVDGNDVASHFDQATGVLTDYMHNAKSYVVDEEFSDPKGAHIQAHIEIADWKSKVTSKANPQGGTDSVLDYNIGPAMFVEHVEGTPGMAPFDINGKAESATFTGTITQLKGGDMLNLWRFFTAHPELMVKDPDKAKLAAVQDELKKGLLAALPVFANMNGTGTYNKVSVVTPVGPVTLDSAAIKMDVNGAVQDGKFEEAIAGNGLVLPPGVVPPWGGNLVPTNFNLDFVASGYDAKSVAEAWLKAADFTKEPPVPPEVESGLAALALPKGTANISLIKSSISNGTYNLTVDGSADVGPTAKPQGKAHVTLKGLDAIMQALQAAPPEADLKGPMQGLVVAKGLAKSEADGTLSWDVVATQDGKITVNGTDLQSLK